MPAATNVGYFKSSPSRADEVGQPTAPADANADKASNDDMACDVSTTTSASSPTTIATTTTAAAAAAAAVENDDDAPTDTDEENSRPVARHEKVTSSFFTWYDEMRDMVQEFGLQYTQIIAIGDQGVGKSTCLNRLFRLMILPRARGFCTLCIIRVQFRRGSSFSCKIEVRSREDSTTVEGTQIEIAYEEFGGIAETVQRKMEELSPDGDIVKDKEIVVQIFSDSQDDPLIDYLDLPGIACTTGDNGQKARDTYQLAKDVIINERDKSIFLLVVGAQNNGISNSMSASLIEKLDENNDFSYKDRTVGVLTKVDMFRGEDCTEGEDLRALLDGEIKRVNKNSEQEYVMNLPNKWFGLASAPRGARVITHDILGKMDDEEADFFSNHEKYKDIWEKKELGVYNLRSVLNKLFEKMIGEDWCPYIESEIRKRFKKNEEENRNLGLPFYGAPHQKKYLGPIEIITKKCGVPHNSLVVSNSENKGIERCLLETSKRVPRFPLLNQVCPDVNKIKADIAEIQQDIDEKGDEKLDQEEYCCKQKKADQSLIDKFKNLQDVLIRCANNGLSRFFIQNLVGKPNNESPLVLDEVKSDCSKLLSILEREADHSSILKLDRFKGLLETWTEFLDKRFDDVSRSFDAISKEMIQAIQNQKFPSLLTQLIHNADDTFQLRAARPGEKIEDALIRIWISEMTAIHMNLEKEFIDQIDPSILQESCVDKREKVLSSMLKDLKIINTIHELQDGVGIEKNVAWKCIERAEDVAPEASSIGNFFGKIASNDQDRDYTIIVDKSASMKKHGDRWKDAENFVKGLIDIRCACDSDGVTLYLFSSYLKNDKGEFPPFNKYDNVSSQETVGTLFNSKENAPKGSTDLKSVLEHAFEASQRPKTVLIITDGKPDDTDSAERLIIETCESLERPDDLLVTIVQIGEDKEADNYLSALGGKLNCQSSVDVFPFSKIPNTFATWTTALLSQLKALRKDLRPEPATSTDEESDSDDSSV